MTVPKCFSLCFFFILFFVSTARPGGIGDVQKSSASNTTLVLSWEPPASPNGVILNYLVRIINLGNGRIVSEESSVGTMATLGGLGMHAE